jgi:23S rRNA (guanosine2251-2'-O)-methyltransferase
MGEPVPDSAEYRKKKAFFDKVLTVYGRKPVLEALQDEQLQCHTLHLAGSNRDTGIIRDIRQLADARGLSVKQHTREQLARISKNGKQDQGVALDILCPSNPQNLGMIIRSAAAGGIDGIIWSRRGNAALGPLVVKASTGTLYRAPLLVTPSLPGGLQDCRDLGMEICILEASAQKTLFAHRPGGHCVYVLGNESEGVSGTVSRLADTRLSIPMNNGVESLNVAVTASLIAYAAYFDR